MDFWHSLLTGEPVHCKKQQFINSGANGKCQNERPAPVFTPCFINFKRVRYINMIGLANLVEKLYK